MPHYEFSWIVEGFDLDDDTTLDLLYTTFEDVSAGSVTGNVTVDFVTEAETPQAALSNTLAHFTATFPHVRVVRMNHDLVTSEDIAERTDQELAHVRLLVNGKGGPGNFPAPVGTLDGGTRVWEWATVTAWFANTGHIVEENTLIDHKDACHFDYTVSRQTKNTTLI